MITTSIKKRCQRCILPDTFPGISFNEETICNFCQQSPSEEQVVKARQELQQQMPEIKDVFVAPSHQNRGLGTLLLREMLGVLKENKIKHFCLASGYVSAQRFWTKRLKKPRYTLHDYWEKGIHHKIWCNQVEEVLNSSFQ